LLKQIQIRFDLILLLLYVIARLLNDINNMKLAKEKYSARSATAVIIANMIGVGVFSALGFQLLEIQSGFVILLLWTIGGLTALLGALSYAELGAALPRSGGEYHFLSKIYHPMVGFVAGWVSTTIGFAAPVAMAAILFASYIVSIYPNLNEQLIAVSLIIILTTVHITNHKSSGGFHQFFTLLKLVLILVFSALAYLWVETPQAISFLPIAKDYDIIFSGTFAVTLIYVNYAYMGWNSATYLSSEIDNPQKNLPKILFIGTFTVVLLYVLLNFIFLYVAPIEEMSGNKEIGFITAKYVFGDIGAIITSIGLAIILVSTASAMIMAGPRAFHAIGEDYSTFKKLSKVNNHNIPVNAIILQSLLSIIFVLSSSFEFILVFAGFTLGLSNFATVLGVIVLRFTQPNLKRPYKTFLYPITPIIYLTLMGFTLIYITLDKPQEALMSFAVILFGVIVYFTTNTRKSN
jgi:APA family basic amino acid/polyamine antiporter